MKDLAASIKKYDDFLICMHVDPDGDTIGSACALSLILEKLKKQYKIYSPDPIPQIYRFIKNSQNTIKEPEPGKKYGAVIAVDCGDIKRIAGGAK
ncbi:MAG: DHH family phosphoesterase, partial [Candidatus Margulisiibacteriota bacterium]